MTARFQSDPMCKKVYELDYSEHHVREPKSFEIKFRWPRDTPCRGTFFCPRLRGHVCGNYGIHLDDGAADICFENIVGRREFEYGTRSKSRKWLV